MSNVVAAVHVSPIICPCGHYDTRHGPQKILAGPNAGVDYYHCITCQRGLRYVNGRAIEMPELGVRHCLVVTESLLSRGALMECAKDFIRDSYRHTGVYLEPRRLFLTRKAELEIARWRADEHYEPHPGGNARPAKLACWDAVYDADECAFEGWA